MAEKIKILVVDDEADFCLLVQDNLEDTEEFEVVTCSDPARTEEVLRDEKPDLLLLDNVMPERKGSQIAKSLKVNDEFKDLPIIMVSGRGEMVYFKKNDQFRWMSNTPIVKDRGEISDSKNPEALSAAYGVDDYVAKPFSTETLVEVIHEVLGKKQKNSDNEEQSPGTF